MLPGKLVAEARKRDLKERNSKKEAASYLVNNWVGVNASSRG
jgi:hypothetical protein